jgi:hypothetical protein
MAGRIAERANIYQPAKPSRGCINVAPTSLKAMVRKSPKARKFGGKPQLLWTNALSRLRITTARQGTTRST